MDDDRPDAALDALLARSAPVVPPAARRSATRLARETTRPRGLARWWRHRLVRIGTAVGVVMALGGAGTMAAYELSIPPFQTTPPGVIRIQPGIPVNYTNSLGRQVECLAFMEFKNIDNDQYTRLAAIRESPVWVGWGDRTLQELGVTDATPQQQFSEISSAASEEMLRQARTVIPDLVAGRDADGPVFSGTAMSCTGPGGSDGRP